MVLVRRVCDQPLGEGVDGLRELGLVGQADAERHQHFVVRRVQFSALLQSSDSLQILLIFLLGDAQALPRNVVLRLFLTNRFESKHSLGQHPRLEQLHTLCEGAVVVHVGIVLLKHVFDVDALRISKAVNLILELRRPVTVGRTLHVRRLGLLLHRVVIRPVAVGCQRRHIRKDAHSCHDILAPVAELVRPILSRRRCRRLLVVQLDFAVLDLVEELEELAVTALCLKIYRGLALYPEGLNPLGCVLIRPAVFVLSLELGSPISLSFRDVHLLLRHELLRPVAARRLLRRLLHHLMLLLLLLQRLGVHHPRVLLLCKKLRRHVRRGLHLCRHPLVCKVVLVPRGRAVLREHLLLPRQVVVDIGVVVQLVMRQCAHGTGTSLPEHLVHAGSHGVASAIAACGANEITDEPSHS
eukprot:Rhum_TRINITY_DN17010_c0_g1::Rhum_TRINITY_DN17010_c0_g1_i1::g.165057::m.165057